MPPGRHDALCVADERRHGSVYKAASCNRRAHAAGLGTRCKCELAPAATNTTALCSTRITIRSSQLCPIFKIWRALRRAIRTVTSSVDVWAGRSKRTRRSFSSWSMINGFWKSRITWWQFWPSPLKQEFSGIWRKMRRAERLAGMGTCSHRHLPSIERVSRWQPIP